MLGHHNQEVETYLTGIYAEIVDYNRLYESVSDKAILVNNFDLRDEEEKARLNKCLFVEYEGDTLDTMPSCDCGHLKGEFNSGVRCDKCGTLVVAVTERPLESIIWVKVPKGVKAFISPSVWNILNAQFKYRGVLMIRWLTDRTYTTKNNIDRPGVDPSEQLFDKFRSIGWKRSINHFIENFDQAMKIMFDHRVVSPAAKRIRTEQFIAENRSKFFPEYLPIPNRAIFITEKTALGTYTDFGMLSAIDAVRTISSLDSGIRPATQEVKENRAIKVTYQLSAFYTAYTKENLSKKPGMFRRQIYGSRLDFSGRCVITSLSHPHRYDELHFPWGLAVTVLKTHITSKLMRRGLSPSESERFLMLHTNRYHPELDAIFKELIAESPYMGIPCLLQRNPSLVRGSAQQFYITQVKTDPSINTISISVLCLAAPNADFDGDEMNCELLLDVKEHDAFSKLAPHYGILDTHKPFNVSSNVAIPKPVISTISSWIHEFD